jgi:hypothetical protein
MARLNAQMSGFGITQGTIAVYTTTDDRHPHKHCRWQELKAEVLERLAKLVHFSAMQQVEQTRRGHGW